MLDLRRLRVLQAVAREGSLAAAARSLGYTQPAVGHHVRRLEAEVGTPLVLRRGRGVMLTPAGRTLAARADALLAAAAAAADEVAAVAGLRGGRLRLAAFPSGTATLVPPALAALRRRAPALEVTLVEVEPPDSLGLVLRGEADLALAFEYPGVALDADAGLARFELQRDEVLAVLPEGHPLAAADVVRPGALRDATWIAGCERCRGHLVHLCAEAGFVPRIAFATDDYVAAQSMVAAGVGVTMLPRLALDAATRPGVVAVPIAGRPARTVSAVVLAGADTVPAVRAMLDALGA